MLVFRAGPLLKLMAWIALAESHVMDRLSEDERAAYEAAGEEEGATDRLPGILIQITAKFRGAIAACDKNRGRMGPSGTLPEEAIFDAATLARDALAASLPTPEGATELRTKETNQAEEFLKRVASCDIAIADDSGNYPGEPIDTAQALWGGNRRECW